jgi:hypothetical protein
MGTSTYLYAEAREKGGPWAYVEMPGLDDDYMIANLLGNARTSKNEYRAIVGTRGLPDDMSPEMLKRKEFIDDDYSMAGMSWFGPEEVKEFYDVFKKKGPEWEAGLRERMGTFEGAEWDRVLEDKPEIETFRWIFWFGY